MSHDALIRTAAVVAAAALLAAPYRRQIAGWLSTAAEAAKAHGAILGRIAAAGLVLAAAWGKLPLPSLQSVVAPVAVETPSDAMQRCVTPVAEALAGLGPLDRAVWAQTWNKAAVVVAGDATTTQTVFTDTRSLRLFTTLAMEIAWRRIGQHAPGSVAGLKDAVEAAYGSVLGTDDVPVTADVRARYVELAKALAWAGVGGG